MLDLVCELVTESSITEILSSRKSCFPFYSIYLLYLCDKIH